jgi:hypothetical protein
MNSDDNDRELAAFQDPTIGPAERAALLKQRAERHEREWLDQCARKTENIRYWRARFGIGPDVSDDQVWSDLIAYLQKTYAETKSIDATTRTNNKAESIARFYALVVEARPELSGRV